MIPTPEQIRLEQDAVMILSSLIHYGPGLVWTQRTIAHVLRCPERRVAAALSRLTDDGHLRIKGGSYMPTLEGREYFDGVCRDRRFAYSTHEWRLEVLTGTDYHGQQTTIDRAVLPGPVERPVVDYTPEKALQEAEQQERRVRKLCSRLGIDREEYERRIKDGSIKLCKGIDPLFPHIGIFDRHGGKRGGFQYLCRECFKKVRKRRKK